MGTASETGSGGFGAGGFGAGGCCWARGWGAGSLTGLGAGDRASSKRGNWATPGKLPPNQIKPHKAIAFLIRFFCLTIFIN
jgi:hypothetical protein